MIGLSTYAYFWRLSERSGPAMTLSEALRDAHVQGIELFQICDHAPLEHMTAREIHDIASESRDLGIAIQLGTRGIRVDHLERFLRLADAFDARLVRSMTFAPGSEPDAATAISWLRAAMGTFEKAGVTLALETYEQIATDDLLHLITAVDSSHLGVCLDPANVVARLENPVAVVESTSPHVKNVHAKDFAFSRTPGWVGFTYGGAPMGTGLNDYPHLLRTVRPRDRGIDEIVEHWLAWQGDPMTTIDREREWTRGAIDFLRSTE